jgi:hypothetical protein
MSSIVFATIGPHGTNHEFVTRKYLDFHRLSNASLLLTETTDEAMEGVRGGSIDYFILCAVHPDTPRIVGRFFREVFIVDTFISPSLPLAVLSRIEVAAPRSIGVLHPSTTAYVDTRKWEKVVKITTGSLHTIAEGLLNGEYDAGLVYLNYSDRYPDRLRIDERIGSPDDAWLVLGRQRTYADPILAWRDSPVSRLFADRLAAA